MINSHNLPKLCHVPLGFAPADGIPAGRGVVGPVHHDRPGHPCAVHRAQRFLPFTGPASVDHPQARRAHVSALAGRATGTRIRLTVIPRATGRGHAGGTALAEAEKVARLAADRGVEPGLGHLAGGWRPAGEPLVASDVYGSRRLVMAPFGCDGRAPDHWYAWDIDVCWIAVVAGAGVFASAEEALREWRDAVGPAVSGAALSSCPAGMTAQLLGSCLRTGPLADTL
jgi:hypothetical protein